MSKLGPHIILPTDAAMAWARRANIVKTVDQVGPLEAAPDAAIRVFRHYFPTQNVNDPVGTANAVIAALKGYRHPNLYAELWNEAHPGGGQMSQAVAICRAAGVKVAVGSWGTGDYTEADWTAARSISGGGADAIAVHCYWGNQGFTPYHALRYRQFWQPGDPPILITECGRDAIEGGAAGWQASGITAQQYASELLTYAGVIDPDSYVLGANPFTAGPTPDWLPFSTDLLDTSQFYAVEDGMEDQIAALQAQVKALQQQNTILTSMWVNFRKGEFTGADSIDGKIIAMQGGAPLGFTPSYPKA